MTVLGCLGAQGCPKQIRIRKRFENMFKTDKLGRAWPRRGLDIFQGSGNEVLEKGPGPRVLARSGGEKRHSRPDLGPDQSFGGISVASRDGPSRSMASSVRDQ